MKNPNIFLKITVLTIISSFLFTNISSAKNISLEADQNRSLLSPIVQLNNQLIQQGFSLNDPQLPSGFPSPLVLGSYSLDQLTQLIIGQCENGNFSLLKVNWEKKHLDYQQFIKEAAAINAAINHIIYSGDMSNNKHYASFLEQAANSRIDIIQNYQAPLSVKGIESLLFISHSHKNLGLLKLLINPPAEWFKPLFDDARKQTLISNHEPPSIVATWGCSTQCDHCDGAAVIEIESFPWVWLKETQEISNNYALPMGIAPYHNDHFRDYYDLVYDKDASDLYQLMDNEETSTSGFAPGSVGERALKRVLYTYDLGTSKMSSAKQGWNTFQISVAPSAWMRSVIQKQGVTEYIDYLLNIEEIFNRSKAGNLLKYATYNFKRKNDPDFLSEILDFCKNSNKTDNNMLIHISGRYYQLVSRGDITAINSKDNLYQLERYLEQGPQNPHFIFDDLEQYFLLPDGQVIYGIAPNIQTLMRRYTTVSGLYSIGKRKISCLACQRPDCNGKKNSDCIGRKQVFNHLDLSSSGGFSSSYLLISASI